MSSTTSNELALTKYSAGENPWDHSSGLDTIDTQVSRLLRGRVKARAALGDGDATPSVQNTAFVETGSTTPTNLTDFDDGSDEQFLVILGADGGNTTIVHDGTNIDLIGAASVVLEDDDVLVLTLVGTCWVEVCRSIAGGITASMIADGAVTEDKIGTGAVTSGKIGAGEVGATEMSFAAASGSMATAGDQEVNIGNSHMHSLSAAGVYGVCKFAASTSAVATAGQLITLTSSISYSLAYHSSSPPHILCGEEWGSFMWLLRKKSDGSIVASLHANDPVWCMDSSLGMWPKNDPRRIAKHPCPFLRVAEDEEVVLVDMREHDFEVAPFSKSRVRAQEIRKDALRMAESSQDIVSVMKAMRDADELEASEPKVDMRRMFSIMKKSEMYEDSPWLYHSKTPLVLEATREVLDSSGKPLKTGVPAFDDVVTIVRRP